MGPLPDIGRRRRLSSEPAARDVRPLPWASIENFERGAPVLDTGSAETAARELALAEDRVVFYGDPAGSGFLTNRKSPRITTHDWSRPGQVLADLVKAVETLDAVGIPGPYETVLPPPRYYAYLQSGDDSAYPPARQLTCWQRCIARR